MKKAVVGWRRYEPKAAGWKREHIRVNDRWELNDGHHSKRHCQRRERLALGR